ncbi:MAG TPA: HisA/HisF-related TIM barrel protein [candidate division Zixibacteria bacterium]|nr:HisA/HisF-related TIM barrel protein [candidate division Zixibacteria bacterium]
MIVIPVLDLLSGKVVQGIGGKRKEYQPISDSVLVSTAEPIDVLQNFKEKLGLNWFYIAELDLIQKATESPTNIEKGNSSNTLKILEIVNKKKFQIMIDGGCRNLTDIEHFLSLGVNQVILGTETLASLEIIEKAVKKFGGEKIILSIDLKEGKLLANSEELQKISPIEIARKAENLGLKAIIVLDLKKVGSESGPISAVLLEIAKEISKVPIFTGGGVRDINDLIVLQQNGIQGALIATALHKGKIGKNELQQLKY